MAFADDRWELYHVAVDPSECHDLADAEPERLAAMVERWWQEARTYGVLPLDNRPFSELVFGRPGPCPTGPATSTTRASAAVPEMVAVNVRNRDHRIVATVDIPDPGRAVRRPRACSWPSAPVWAAGRSTWTTADPPTPTTSCPSRSTTSRRPSGCPPDATRWPSYFERTGEHRGIGHLEVDGIEVARGDIPRFTLTKFSGHGRRAHLRLQRRPAGDPPLRGPVPLHRDHRPRSVVEVDGPPWSDPEADAEEPRWPASSGADGRWPNSPPNSSTPWPRPSATRPPTAWSAAGR